MCALRSENISRVLKATRSTISCVVKWSARKFLKVSLRHVSLYNGETLRWMDVISLVRQHSGSWQTSGSVYVAKWRRSVQFCRCLVQETSHARSRPRASQKYHGVFDIKPLESGLQNGLPCCAVHLHQWLLSSICVEGFLIKRCSSKLTSYRHLDSLTGAGKSNNLSDY